MTASGGVIINGGLLDGTGTINVPVSIGAGGFLLPGYFNAGTLAIGGNVTFDPAAQFFVIANGSTTGTFSLLDVTGTVSLNGATVGISQNATYMGNSSIALTVLSATSTLSGSFSKLTSNITTGFDFAFSKITYPSNTVLLQDPVPVEGDTLTVQLPPPPPGGGIPRPCRLPWSRSFRKKLPNWRNYWRRPVLSCR